MVSRIDITGTGLYIPEYGDTISSDGINLAITNTGFEEFRHYWLKGKGGEEVDAENGAEITGDDYSYVVVYQLSNATHELASDFQVYYNNKLLQKISGRQVPDENQSYFTYTSGTIAIHLFSDVMETREYSYNTLSGDNAKYNNESLTFRFDGPHYNVREVSVNDIIIDSANYEITKGSTVLTLTDDYLSGLENGTYEISIVYNDDNESTARASFVVEEPEVETASSIDNPKTIDNIVLYIALGLVSLVGLGVITIIFKKKFN